MINLNDYVNNLHVSLDEVDESLKDKINNLEGYVINECCGCCCGCACDEKIQNAQAIAPRNLFGRFNSIQDIINELEYNRLKHYLICLISSLVIISVVIQRTNIMSHCILVELIVVD